MAAVCVARTAARRAIPLPPAVSPEAAAPSSPSSRSVTVRAHDQSASEGTRRSISSHNFAASPAGSNPQRGVDEIYAKLAKRFVTGLAAQDPREAGVGPGPVDFLTSGMDVEISPYALVEIAIDLQKCRAQHLVALIVDPLHVTQLTKDLVRIAFRGIADRSMSLSDRRKSIAAGRTSRTIGCLMRLMITQLNIGSAVPLLITSAARCGLSANQSP